MGRGGGESGRHAKKGDENEKRQLRARARWINESATQIGLNETKSGDLEFSLNAEHLNCQLIYRDINLICRNISKDEIHVV